MSVSVGIDVGGARKGFHAVALTDGRYLDCIKSKNVGSIRTWCDQLRADVVAVDAPCRWAEAGKKSRPVERKLNKLGIRCFYTPNEARANQAKSKAWNYEWIRCASTLYAELSDAYPLFLGVQQGGKVCVETFPHAVASVLANEVVKGDEKQVQRREILRALKIEFEEIGNGDFSDAAICAFAAHCFGEGKWQAVGTTDEGYIVVPSYKRQLDGALKP